MHRADQARHERHADSRGTVRPADGHGLQVMRSPTGDHPHIKHHSLDMTLHYAKIANRTVADEYFAVTDKVEALYGHPAPLPAEAAGPKMTRLRREHYRMLGNGYCARPSQLDCTFESICETCTYFQPTIEFRPTLQRQRDDAAIKDQTGRQQLFDQLLNRLDQNQAS
jgi:hypothetical protein